MQKHRDSPLLTSHKAEKISGCTYTFLINILKEFFVVFGKIIKKKYGSTYLLIFFWFFFLFLLKNEILYVYNYLIFQKSAEYFGKF